MGDVFCKQEQEMGPLCKLTGRGNGDSGSQVEQLRRVPQPLTERKRLWDGKHLETALFSHHHVMSCSATGGGDREQEVKDMVIFSVNLSLSLWGGGKVSMSFSRF